MAISCSKLLPKCQLCHPDRRDCLALASDGKGGQGGGESTADKRGGTLMDKGKTKRLGFAFLGVPPGLKIKKRGDG